MINKRSRIFRGLCFFLAFLLAQNSLERVQAQPTPFLPIGHDYFVDLSIPYSLPVLRGMRVYPSKPFQFDFVVDSGAQHTLDQKQTSLLVKYFLTCLTIPEEDLWVNLSPYEAGRIIPDELSLTDAGNTLLEQDKFLKQLASSMTYPESRLGKEFWSKVYKKAYEKFGTTDLPLNTYNKVWIVPDKAVVYDMGDSALIGETHLKVMLEEDYLALKKHSVQVKSRTNDVHQLTSMITKEIILPELEKEVNEGKNFAAVRQIFHSMVLAAWFKRALQRNVLSKYYVNKKKISGVDGVDPNSKERIYKQYLHIYKVGAYNYIREDVDPISQQLVPRKYFSGGLFFGDLDRSLKTLQVPDFRSLEPYLDQAQVAGSSYGVARVELSAIGHQKDLDELVDMSDKAQVVISPNRLRQLVSVFALVVTFSLPGIAHAAQFTPNPDGKTLQVKVEKNDTLGQILLDAHYKSPLWGPNGTVARVGKTLLGQIPDAEHIYVGDKFNIQKPEFESSLPVKPVQQPDRQPVVQSRGAPHVIPPAPVTKLAAKQPNASFYQISATAPTISITEFALAKNNGIIAGLNPAKLKYRKGETIFIIEDLQVQAHIQALASQLEIQTKTLDELKGLNTNAASLEIIRAQEQVNETRLQLAQARQERANGIVSAPYDMEFKVMKFKNGEAVTQGTKLFSYFDLKRVRVDLEVPSSVNYFYNIKDLTLNGVSVRNIYSVNWSPSPLLQKVRLSLIVTPASPIPGGQVVSLSGRIFTPENDRSLDSVLTVGPGTDVRVKEVVEYPITASAEGQAEFLVGEGAQVRRGQPLALLNAGYYKLQLGIVDQEIRNVEDQVQVALSADGTRPEIDSLNIQKAALRANRDMLLRQIELSTIRAPYDGVIVWSAQHGALTFKLGDPLFNEINGTVLLGDAENYSKDTSILFSSQLSIKKGDPVLVQTPQGVRLKGQVIAVNKNPYSPSNQLGAVQSVEIKVWDPQKTLRLGLAVQVTLIAPRSAGAPPPPPKGHGHSSDHAMIAISRRGFIKLFAAAVGSAVGSHVNAQMIQNPVNPPPLYSSPEGGSLNIAQILKLVVGNDLTAGPESIQVLESKAAEGLPKAKEFSLVGDAWRTGDGKYYFNGGLEGILGDVAGGLSTGNAIAAGLPIVFQLAGSVIDMLSHKKDKQVKLAVAMTEIAMRHYETVLYQQVKGSNFRLIELGRAEQRIAQLKTLLADLNEARDEILVRQAGRFNTPSDRFAIEEKINAVKSQISDLQGSSLSSIVEINAFIGRQADLHQVVWADLPWKGDFPAISAAQELEFNGRLTADDSPDPRMREAIASRKAMDETVRLQGLDKLPVVNLAGLYSSAAPNNSLYDFLPGSVMRTSEEKKGTNGALHIQIPIFDQQTKIRSEIIALERKETEKKIEEKKVQLAAELAGTVGAIRSLSVQIGQAEETYQSALASWEFKASRRYRYLPHEFIDERVQLDQWMGKIIDLKAQYLKQEANLRQMGLLRQDETLVKDQAMIVDPWKFSRPLALTVFMISLFSPINASAQNDPWNAYAPSQEFTMLGNNQSALNISSLNDPNFLNRMDALNGFLKQYQNNPDFINSFQEAILTSQYPDVAEQLFKFMVERRDLRFFIQIIVSAEEKNDLSIVEMAYRSLDDILTMHPEVLQGLTPADFTSSQAALYPKVSPETAEKVFVNFLLTQSDGSIGKEHLLQSDYWTVNDLARIYQSLSAYADSRALASLIRDSILRKEALDNIDEIFRPGSFASPGGVVLDKDVAAYVKIRETAQQEKLFLNSSPRWRAMRDYIHPQLYADVLAKVKSLLAPKYAGDVKRPFYMSSLPAPSIDDGSAYFQGLGLDAQGEYIANSQDIPELATLLELKTPFRAAVLDRLMSDHQGRLLVLKDYLGSKDPELLVLIEFYPAWQDALKSDVRLIKDSANERILRLALEKIYARTRNTWALNIRLETYSDIELHSADDPRGAGLREAEINAQAARIALDVLDEDMLHKPVWWAGYRVRSTEEIEELKILRAHIDQETDPVKINDYIDAQAGLTGNHKVKEMLQYIISLRKEIGDNIRNNDQSVPKFPFLWHLVFAAVAVLVGFLFVKNRHNRYKAWQRKDDVVASIIHLAHEVTNLAHFDGFNGPGTDEPNNEMVEIRKDGLTIINMPKPVRVDVNAQKTLENWWNKVIKWNSARELTNEQIVSDFHFMTENALETLTRIPYDARMMRSPSGIIQKSLFYYITIANYTLYLLSKNLKGRTGLTAGQVAQLKADKEKLVQSIYYVTDFTLVLHYRANITRVLTRKLPDSNSKEKPQWYLFGLSWYRIAREFLLYQWLLRESDKELKKNLDRLLTEGDELLNIYLYKNPEGIKHAGETALNDIIKNGGMGETIRAHKAEYSDKIGNFWREIKYPIQAFLVLVSFVGLVIGIPGLIAFNIDITVPSLIFLSWSWFAYVKPNWDAMNTSWSKEINNLAKFQDEGMNDIHADHAQLSAPQTIYQAGQVLPAANPEIKGKGQGGIDLNFKPQFIPRPSQERTEYFEKAVIPAMPDGFKGFNFNIVRFRSQLTVNGAFQLMCNSN